MASEARGRSLARTLVGLALIAQPTACLLDWDALRSDGSEPVDGGTDTGTDAKVDAGAEGGGPETGADSSTCGDKMLVINELQTGGSGGPTDEFVELYNPSPCDVMLNGWSLKYSSATGSTPFPAWTGSSTAKVPAMGYAVLGGQGFQGAVLDHFGNSGGTLASSGGGVGIFDRGNSAVDSVAYGAVNAGHPFLRPADGGAAPAPGVGQAVGRLPNGKNTNVNASDFVILSSPSPGAKNS